MRKGQPKHSLIGGLWGALGGVCSVALLLSGCGGGNGGGGVVVPGAQGVFQQAQLLLGGQPVSDPATGRPLRFIHVNLGGANGNGTFENPFNTIAQGLAAAQPNDVVFVRATAPGATAGFVVPARVKVLTSGPTQIIATREAAQVKLPGSGTGTLPVVTSTITLNNNSSLSGFDVNPAAGDGIRGDNVTGTLLIDSNTVRRAVGTNSGIAIVAGAGALTITIRGNTVSNATDSGISIQSNDTSQVTATVTGNTSKNNVGSGIFFFLNGGQVTATVEENTTTGNRAREPQEAGVRFGVFNNARGTVTMRKNQSNANQGNGLFTGTQGTSRVNATLTDNTCNDNVGHGIFLGANENATGTGTITNNTTHNNKVNAAFAPFPTGSGIFLGVQVSANMTAEVAHNDSAGNGDIGIFFFIGNNGRGTANIHDNTSTNNTRNGIEVNAGLNGAPGNPAAPGDAPVATARVIGNTVVGNKGIGPPLGGGGIFVLGFNRAAVSVKIENNQVRENALTAGGFGGMALVAVQNAQIAAGVRSNTFSRNGGNNPAFTALTGVPSTVLGGALAGPSRICLELTGNTSDASYGLVRMAAEQTLQANYFQNVGGVVRPLLPVEPLSDCAVP